MKSAVEFLADADVPVAKASVAMLADTASFDSIWKEALNVFSGQLEPAVQSGGASSSVYMDAANNQAALLGDAFKPMDMTTLGKMSTIEIIETMSNKKIAQDASMSLMNINLAVMKNARQAVDAVMNSK